MDKLVINGKTRTESGKTVAKRLRASGRIPAVVYNSKGEATMLDVDEVEFNKVWRAITPTTMITLKVDGKDAKDALIKDTEYNIRTDKVLHADFFEPAADEKLTAVMKIQYSGTPAGVLKGGFLLKHIPDVKVQAVPSALPARVVVDISKVNIGESICVKDLSLGEGVTILTDENLPVVSVSPAR